MVDRLARILGAFGLTGIMVATFPLPTTAMGIPQADFRQRDFLHVNLHLLGLDVDVPTDERTSVGLSLSSGPLHVTPAFRGTFQLFSFGHRRLSCGLTAALGLRMGSPFPPLQFPTAQLWGLAGFTLTLPLGDRVLVRSLLPVYGDTDLQAGFRPSLELAFPVGSRTEVVVGGHDWTVDAGVSTLYVGWRERAL